MLLYCSIPHCNLSVDSKGYCRAHYIRSLRGSDMMKPLQYLVKPIDRFMAKVDKTPDGCWRWTASKTPEGYGNFAAGGRNSLLKAHKFAYEYFKGSIPKGLEIDHICCVRDCVNPDHLQLLTHKENIQRAFILRKKARTTDVAPPSLCSAGTN
jgi:hypothetical protein